MSVFTTTSTKFFKNTKPLTKSPNDKKVKEKKAEIYCKVKQTPGKYGILRNKNGDEANDENNE